ncbi:MAG TPA: hypothetical protein VFA16_10720 [Mycobacterium sp.]|jgi:hypothetical protein|uniref:hypothetical protein n=1 Tax=Mycobacterium sp. TaxID=1785 RepID=UPI002D4B63B4|nr:hypothetical protein [Mycobacterium sp.]HZU47703.1 hypothetical protein [Mycobacterium sp.]
MELTLHPATFEQIRGHCLRIAGALALSGSWDQADPGMADVLAATPNEAAVPMRELGHSVEPSAATDPWLY